MGLYQRCLEDFTETPYMTNEQTDRNCMNCHSFCNRNPQKMMFHMRAKNGGTFTWDGARIEKLNTKTPQTLSALVYPRWHPSGRKKWPASPRPTPASMSRTGSPEFRATRHLQC